MWTNSHPRRPFVPWLTFVLLTLVVTGITVGQEENATDGKAETTPAVEAAPAGETAPAGEAAAATETKSNAGSTSDTEEPGPVIVEGNEVIQMPEDEEPLTPEQAAIVKRFIAARGKWSDTLVEMKSVAIRYSNEEDKTPEALKQYRMLRDRARVQMNETFDIAVELLRARPRDYEAGSLLATVLEYRESTSIYENSLEAAEMLLDQGLTFPFLYLISARSAFLEGKFDIAKSRYQEFVKLHTYEKLEDVDKMFSSMGETYAEFWQEELKLREAEAKADDLPRVLLETTRGPVTIELFENEAPNTVANFIQLVEDGYYDGADFYQVVDDFLALGGDPVGDGTGTSGRLIPDEHDRPKTRQLFRGSMLMAKIPDPADKNSYLPNSASSQFAIALVPLIREDRKQTIFGRVIEGIDVVSSFRRADPAKKKEKSVQLPPDRIITAKVIRKREHEYKVEYAK